MAKNRGRIDEKRKSDTIGICFLITDFDAETGGVQTISKNLLSELNKHGNQTFVCCRDYYNRQRNEHINGTLIHRSPTFKYFSTVLNSLSYLIDGLFWLIKNRDKYDVIHCQQIFAPAMLGLLAKKFLRKPVLTAVHSSGNRGEINDLKKSSSQGLRVQQFQKVDFWTVLSKEMKEEVESLGIPSEKIKLVPNAASIPKEAVYQNSVKQSYRTKLDLPYEQIVIFTGRLSAEKGLDTLISAWKEISEANPNAHLLILGKGGGFPDVESEIKELTNELNLNNTVHFLGFKSNPMDYLLASDVFVLPSLTEGMSVAVIEAMAAGLAMVVTDIPANQYLCQHNINSLHIKTKNADELTASVNSILANQELKERLGKAARERAERDLSIETMTDRYLTIYSELIKSSK